ncbi:MAG: ATP-binding protein, partial [Bdellovibrionales bacterium]
SVPSELVIDETRTSQVFGNLLNNAIKFSDSGTIKVSVQARDNRLALSVEDMGIGISPMDQKNLFQMFSQADSSIARRFGGSGLGLALSKRISEAMGGTLELMWSVPGKGSHFQFQVPFDVPHALRPASCESSPNRRPAGRGSTTHHVLLAEDSPDNVFLICHLIEPLGYRIDVATDGLAAVEAALQKHYDFILMDIQMPRMDGLEATRQIRAHGFKNPIIALTAHALRSEAERSLAAGCNRHLTKPVSRAELIEVLSDTRAHAP